jgi:hypothetical protein
MSTKKTTQASAKADNAVVSQETSMNAMNVTVATLPKVLADIFIAKKTAIGVIDVKNIVQASPALEKLYMWQDTPDSVDAHGAVTKGDEKEAARLGSAHAELVEAIVDAIGKKSYRPLVRSVISSLREKKNKNKAVTVEDYIKDLSASLDGFADSLHNMMVKYLMSSGMGNDAATELLIDAEYSDVLVQEINNAIRKSVANCDLPIV